MGRILQKREGDTVTVTLSSPARLNAIDIAMWQQLSTVFCALSLDESLRCVIVRGEGGNFAAGADIAEFAEQRASSAQGIRYHTKIIAPALEAVANCIHPTIAAINGACVGGGLEIACACDLRIASSTSRFGVPINRLGFALAPSEMQGLLQLVGLATTLEILLEGRVIDAVEAQQKGLLHRITDDLDKEVAQTVQRIAAGAPLAARMNKRLARSLSPQPQALDAQAFANAYALLDSHDYREGVAAFLARRKPDFSGR